MNMHTLPEQFKRAWLAVGLGLFWILFPAIFLYLRRSERARIILASGNSVLLVKPWLGRGAWELPGGGLKSRETAEQAAVRELLEETGINIPPTEVAYLFEHQARGLTRHCVHAEIATQAQIKITNHEIGEAVWANIDDLVEMKVENISRTMLQAWLEHRKLLQ